MMVSTDGFLTTSKSPVDVWYLNGVLDPMKPLCLDTLFRLKNLELPIRPPEKWTKAFDRLASNALIPWSQVMPSTAYKHFVKVLVKTITETIDELPKDYYKNAWCPGGQLLCSLKAARIDPAIYRDFSTSIDRDSGAFETFKPGAGGFLQPVIYDRFATRTGRLTVTEGPNILTLKKDYRRMLKSTFSDGVVCSLDFSALEARIILAEAGKSTTNSDLYEELSQKLFDRKVDRNVVKSAVISELYGASKASLANRLGINGRKLDEFVTTIRSYFGVAELRKRLKDEFMRFGKVRNKHGRFLDLDDPQDHLFVNTFAQSTGVDVSLLGFKSVMDRLGTDGVRPLFVLHDALILDVRGDRLGDVEAIDSVEVPLYDARFPLKLEKI